MTAVALAPDPVLPHRDALLDDAYVGARIDALLAEGPGGGATTSCTRLRAKYRIGESLRATFRVYGDSGERVISARMFAPDRALAQFARAQSAAARDGAPEDSVLYDASLGTVFWVYPQDRKLVGLAALTSPPAELRAAFGEPWTRSELVAYCPEKAATARCLSESGATIGYAKVHLGDEGERSIGLLRAARRGLPRDGLLHTPRAVGYWPEHHLALYTPAPGSPLNELPRRDMPGAMSALGAALSTLHRQPTAGFPSFERLSNARVVSAGELVRTARPDLTDQVQTLIGALLSTSPRPAADVLLHGDLHPKNVLVHRAGVSQVDLDQAATGPAAAELGGLLARLWCPRPSDQLDGATAAAGADALLAAYDNPPEREDLRWYAAAALLVERAVRAINRVDVDGMHALPGVLSTACDWAQQVPGSQA